jgi:hypothetical protein
MNIGHVFRIWTTLATPPKEKIVLCVGDDLFLWFNTDARHRPAQMQVAAGEAPSITRPCYLDCGRVTVFPTREIERASDCGRSSDAFLLRVAEEVELRATSVVALHRRIIVAALRRAAGGQV